MKMFSARLSTVLNLFIMSFVNFTIYILLTVPDDMENYFQSFDYPFHILKEHLKEYHKVIWCEF